MESPAQIKSIHFLRRSVHAASNCAVFLKCPFDSSRNPYPSVKLHFRAILDINRLHFLCIIVSSTSVHLILRCFLRRRPKTKTELRFAFRALYRSFSWRYRNANGLTSSGHFSDCSEVSTRYVRCTSCKELTLKSQSYERPSAAPSKGYTKLRCISMLILTRSMSLKIDTMLACNLQDE